MLKLGAIRFRGKCSKHPHYDPHDGTGAIKGGCTKCQLLVDILCLHTAMLTRMCEVSPPKDMRKFRAFDDKQLGLFTEEEESRKGSANGTAQNFSPQP